jgi:hypothetical protein
MAERARPTRSRKLVDLTVDEMVRVSTAFARSGRFTIKERGQAQPRPLTVEEIFVIVLAGQEIGIGPSQAVMGIKMIEGKPELSAGLMAAMVKNSGRYDFRTEWGSDEDKWAEVTFYDTDSGDAIGSSRFSEADARTAGLWRNNYLTYWRNMLFARALSNGVKWYCPDALMVSAYHEGEIYGDTEASIPELPQQPSMTMKEIQQATAEEFGDPPPVSRANPEPVDELVDAEDVEVQQVGFDVSGPLDYDPVTPQEDLFDPATEPGPAPVLAPTTGSPEPVVTQKDHEPTITPAQIRLLHAKARAANLTDERRHEILLEVTGVSHTDRVPKSKMDAILKRFTDEATLFEQEEATS